MNGVIYVATGEEFVEEAAISARSVTESMPGVGVTLFTDEEPVDHPFDDVRVLDTPHYGFLDKVLHLESTPYERTLYLDTDTYVDSDASELFELLDRFDIGAAYNHNREAVPLDTVPRSFPEYNTGVVIYENNERVQALFDRWKELYRAKMDEHPHDQPTFREALYESDVRVATLPTEYNCLVRYPGHVRNKVKIFHSRLLDLDTPGAGKSVEMTAAIDKLNEYDGHRIFAPTPGSGGPYRVYNQTKSTVKRGLEALRYGGIRYTVNRIRSRL